MILIMGGYGYREITDGRPAVVQWYQYDDYISWAPLPPRGVSYREPWDEKDSRYWHTVNDKVFLNDNVGHFQESHPVTRINGGQRPSTAPPSSPRNQGGNQGINTPAISKPNVQIETPPPVRPKEMAGDRISVPKSPAPENITAKNRSKSTEYICSESSAKHNFNIEFTKNEFT